VWSGVGVGGHLAISAWVWDTGIEFWARCALEPFVRGFFAARDFLGDF